MDDQDDCAEEWIIEKECCYCKDYKEDNYSDSNHSMVRGMFKSSRRFGIGIIGGIAVAPLVVPPLVVVSAMGAAVSLPFGFLFVTYACTNKVMNMLLPLDVDRQLRVYDPQGDFSEDVYDQGYEEDSGGYVEGDDGSFGGEWKGVEPLDEGDYDERDESERKDVQKEHEEIVSEKLRDEGRDDTVEDGHIVGESATNVVFGHVNGVGESASNVIVCEGVKDVGEGNSNVDVDRGGESASDVVVFGDVDDAGGSGFDVGFGDVDGVGESDSNGRFGDIKDVGTTKTVTVSDTSSQELIEHKVRDTVLSDETSCNSREFAGLDLVAREVVGDTKNDKRSIEAADKKVAFDKESAGMQERNHGNEHKDIVFGYLKDVETNKPESQNLLEAGSKNDEPLNKTQDVVVISDRNDETSFNSREDQELDLLNEVIIEDAKKHQKKIEADEEVPRGSEDVCLRTMEEHLVYSNAGSPKINVDVSRSDSTEERNRNSNLEVGNDAKENVDDADDDNKDVSAYSPLGRAALDTDGAEVASKSYKKTSSREENLDDEKIWEIIGAMRAIVGYNSPSQPTCLGELKALYIFTGVEPPELINGGDSDLDEANVRLKFLMSIVGVK